MRTSKRLFVYLQRPDSGEWVTVGRYEWDGTRERVP
jgi:serine/threonine-protein kinase HipA